MNRTAIACLITIAASVQQASAETAVDAGYRSFELHRYDEASRLFEKGLASRPDDVRARYFDALCHHYLHQYKQAREEYRLITTKYSNSEFAGLAHTALQRLGAEASEPPHTGDVRPTVATSETKSADNGAPADSSLVKSAPAGGEAPKAQSGNA